MNLLGYMHAYGTSEGVKKEWDERNRSKEVKDSRTGKGIGHHGPFANKNDAKTYAQNLGLHSRHVRSRPSGYMVEE